MKLVKLWDGHAGGHVRDMFLAAISAFRDWNSGEPEPMVTFEVNYQPREITLSQACGLLWQCTDILPSLAVSELELCDIHLNRSTYAGAAHVLLERIKKETGNLSTTAS